MSLTMLRPGLASNPPHTHSDVELVLIEKGDVETLSTGTWHRIGPVAVIFNVSLAPHALRKVGSTPARCDVVSLMSADTSATKEEE
jgi:XRE family transcriptional regulator, regulator of sulfur utilization